MNIRYIVVSMRQEGALNNGGRKALRDRHGLRDDKY